MLFQHQSVVGPSCPHMTTFASRCFSVAAPSLWNSLPAGIRACSSPHAFCGLLKTHRFNRPSVPPSGSHKCLGFSLWLTLCTIKYFIYLLTYLSRRWVIETVFLTRNWSHSATYLVLVLVALQKKPHCHFKSDWDEIWQDCSSSIYTASDGMGFMIWSHTMTMTSARWSLLHMQQRLSAAR